MSRATGVTQALGFAAAAARPVPGGGEAGVIEPVPLNTFLNLAGVAWPAPPPTLPASGVRTALPSLLLEPSVLALALDTESSGATSDDAVLAVGAAKISSVWSLKPLLTSMMVLVCMFTNLTSVTAQLFSNFRCSVTAALRLSGSSTLEATDVHDVRVLLRSPPPSPACSCLRNATGPRPPRT